jgi:hypothetical protein
MPSGSEQLFRERSRSSRRQVRVAVPQSSGVDPQSACGRAAEPVDSEAPRLSAFLGGTPATTWRCARARANPVKSLCGFQPSSPRRSLGPAPDGQADAGRRGGLVTRRAGAGLYCQQPRRLVRPRYGPPTFVRRTELRPRFGLPPAFDFSASMAGLTRAHPATRSARAVPGAGVTRLVSAARAPRFLGDAGPARAGPDHRVSPLKGGKCIET